MQHDSMISLRLSEDHRRKHTITVRLLDVNRSRFIETAVDTNIQQHARPASGEQLEVNRQ
ncbi:MAG: hypothetical protein FOGNACKC_01964 [Anaerolineae bacterium]|nr:hypothetical protein [Anaerolineae bacterium]